MILLGSSDIGVLQYLLRLKNIINTQKKWITKNEYLNFLKSNKLNIVKKYQSLKNINLIITGTSLGNSLDKKMVLFGKKKKFLQYKLLNIGQILMRDFCLKKRDYLLMSFL